MKPARTDSYRRFNLTLFALAGALCIAPAAHAQFDAGGHANLMHQHELMRNQSTGDGPDWTEPGKKDKQDRNARRTGISPKDQAAIRAEMQTMFERRRQELLPEYERRVKADGRPAADAWLRQVAAEAGRRDGEAIRAKYGQ